MKISPPAGSRSTPYWRLLAVLTSSIRIESELAYWLYDSALELHDAEAAKGELAGELAEGELRSLDRNMLLGSIAGPGFEATLDTPDGRAFVRFLVTREGLEEHRRKTALTSKVMN